MIILSALAEVDIQVVYNDLFLKNPLAADKLVDDLDRHFLILEQFPEAGHKRLDLTDLPVRFWAIQNYLLIYQVDSNRNICVVRFLHGYQDIASIL
jgi:plasmid stabilization system protein ParE